jgi:hypothetical protein
LGFHDPRYVNTAMTAAATTVRSQWHIQKGQKVAKGLIHVQNAQIPARLVILGHG